MAGGKVDGKVVMLGKEYVGKTSLVHRCLHDKFTAAYQGTIGAAFGAKRIIIDGKPIIMGIWDTAGSERYEAMSRIYYRGARAAIVCYDMTDKASFNRVRFWVQELQKNEENCRIYLCGTKKDMIDQGLSKRQVDYHDVMDYGEEINAVVFETSSKSGENISSLFNKVAEDFAVDMKKPVPKHISATNNADLLHPVDRNSHRGCKGNC